MRFKMKKHDDENDVNLDKPQYMIVYLIDCDGYSDYDENDV